MKINGLIVAAGLSSRMKDFKPLMKINNKPLIMNTIDSLRKSGIKDIYVVVGYRGDEIKKILQNENIHIIHNSNYRNTSMYDSFKLGLIEISNNCDALAFTPGDIGFVSKFTIDLLIDEINKGEKKIIYPMFKGEKGHPPIISSKCFDYLLSYDGYEGLKGGLEYFKYDSIKVETPDKFILLDADTKEDFQKIKNYYENINKLTYEECMYLLQYSNVPNYIIKHCKKVEEIATDISISINKYIRDESKKININLISSAALLHDIKRIEKNHEIKGANFIESLGYEKISFIVKTHMNLDESMKNEINENTILYFSDKLVDEDKFVGLESRFSNKINKFQNDTTIYESIINKYNIALKIKSSIISIVGNEEYNKLENKWRG